MKLSAVLPLTFALFAASPSAAYDTATRNCWGGGNCQLGGCQLKTLEIEVYKKGGNIFSKQKAGTQLACCGRGKKRLCAYTDRVMTTVEINGSLGALRERGCRRCGHYDGLTIKA
ncbi:hypothetical protein EMCG_01788 [[Emmonsia] crescens]|uniref:Killer toxin Kp4 domain-containing protein n=1 Tax=[Emmonsia] crescens TaxID=73230 RepID=A0A0G2J2A4_9EURO|nr:hypothetical protein EMCG_01788 [Emmonsia crescens UAMH 3008]